MVISIEEGEWETDREGRRLDINSGLISKTIFWSNLLFTTCVSNCILLYFLSRHVSVQPGYFFSLSS